MRIKKIFALPDFLRMPVKEFAIEEAKKILVMVPPELRLMQLREYDEYNIIQEDDFIRKLSSWKHPSSIDATYFTVLLLMKLGKQIDEKKKENIMDFVIRLFKKEKDGYIQTLKNGNPSIHSIHSALAIVNLLYRKTESISPIMFKPGGREFFGKHIGAEKVESILRFVATCQNKESGGFSEDPTLGSTINCTASTLWILWQLGALGQFDLEPILNFTISHKEEDSKFLGFKNEIHEEYAPLCATYYSFRIFLTIKEYEKANSTDRKLTRIIDGDIVNQENKEKVINLILNSKGKKLGFGACEKLGATTIHTKYGLSLLANERYNLGFLKYLENHSELDFEKEMDDIECFVESCIYKGVYGFSNKEYYFPNIYATLLSIDIKTYIDKLRNSVKKNVLDDRQKEDIFSFLESCYDKESKGYRGYSNCTSYVPDSFFSG